jgi:hypothetical protein
VSDQDKHAHDYGYVLINEMMFNSGLSVRLMRADDKRLDSTSLSVLYCVERVVGPSGVGQGDIGYLSRMVLADAVVLEVMAGSSAAWGGARISSRV